MPMNLCVAFKTNVIYYWVSGVRIRCLKREQKACFESFVLKLVKRNGEVVSGPVVQLVRALSWYAKVVGSVPSQGTYMTTNECINKWNSK